MDIGSLPDSAWGDIVNEGGLGLGLSFEEESPDSILQEPVGNLAQQLHKRSAGARPRNSSLGTSYEAQRPALSTRLCVSPGPAARGAPRSVAKRSRARRFGFDSPPRPLERKPATPRRRALSTLEARGEIDYAASFVEFYAEEAKRPNIEGVTSHLPDAEVELWSAALHSCVPPRGHSSMLEAHSSNYETPKGK